MTGLTKSAFADFILVSFLVIITITLIANRIKNIIIEVLKEKERKMYEEKRRKELLMYEENCKRTGTQNN